MLLKILCKILYSLTLNTIADIIADKFIERKTDGK